ncbi:MAG: histidine--tRNA ligase [Clostridia bacterium]|nr:histidine--tRNA ligase [Clostridia bacterium]
MAKNIVEPRTLPGFMELLPEDQIEFDRIKNIIEETYKRFGFLPIDTPIIEDSNVLLAKAGGETEKQIYRFNKGDNDLSLRFDLTVPLAKYVAKNQGVLSFPFRRYHIGKVYRAERPQRGRYREFYQCDIDVIGDGELSISNDAEMPSIIYNIFKQLDFGKFKIKINNRKLLGGFFDNLGLQDKITDILRIVDKIDKIGQDNVKDMLKDLGVDDGKINSIIEFVGTKENVIPYLDSLNIENELFKTGLEEIKLVSKYMISFGIPEDYFMIDLSIARGLDYYTGTVYETILVDYPELGSVCSGGRYDNLAEYYTNKTLPGVGISIGLTRLFYVLNEYKLLKENKQKSISKVIVLPMIEDLTYPIKVATMLREKGINTEIFLEEKAFKKKLNYANKQNIPHVIIVGEDEVSQNKVTLKDMTSGEQKTISIEELISELN